MIHVAVSRIFKFDRDGVSTFIYRINNYFSRNVVFDYLAFGLYTEKKYIENIKKNGGSFTILKVARIPVIKEFSGFVLLSKHLREKQYKICYINASDAVNMLGQALAAFIAGVPVRIGHSHSSNLDYTGIKRILKIITHYISKPLLPVFFTDYLSCSDKASIWMYPAYIREKIVKINNPVDADKYFFSEKTREQKRLIMNVSNNFIIGHIGRFTYQKNHTFILKVFKELLKLRKEALLILIGEGPLQKKIKQRAKKLDVIENIIFYDSTTVVYEFMQIFDVFLLPSRFEGLPLVAIEAQSTGLPCFFSDIITKEADVTNNCVFMSLKENPSTWAKKIVEESNSFIRKDCSSLVKQAGFDIRESAQKLEKIFVERMNMLKEIK